MGKSSSPSATTCVCGQQSYHYLEENGYWGGGQILQLSELVCTNHVPYQNIIKLAVLTKKMNSHLSNLEIRELIKILHLFIIKTLLKLRIEDNLLSELLSDILLVSLLREIRQKYILFHLK